MKKFQIQLGLTGISRKEATQVRADQFGAKAQYKGTLSYKFVIPNEEGKEWTVQLNKDIVPEKKEEENIVSAENDYKVDIITSEMTIGSRLSGRSASRGVSADRPLPVHPAA